MVKRLFGCAAFSDDAGVHGRPCQSSASAGAGSSWPSHHGVPSGAQRDVGEDRVAPDHGGIALGLVFRLVPGATPKKPASGLIAHSRPSSPGRSQAMSSPTVLAFHPGIDAGGTSIARLVLPHALGNAAAT